MAVAGAAQDNEHVLIFGLVPSIALMAAAANFIAKLLQRRHWIAYVGLGVIFYVSLDMIWRDGSEVMAATGVSGGDRSSGRPHAVDGMGLGAPATLALLAAGIVLTAVFAVVEVRRTASLFELDLLRIATFTGGNIVFFMFQHSKLAIFVFAALYPQQKLNFSPIDAGLVVTATVGSTVATSFVADKCANRFGSRGPLTIGIALQGSALVIVGLLIPFENYLVLLPALIVWRAAMPVVAVTARPVMSTVPQDQRGQVSGVNLTLQILGGTIGIALCSTLLISTGGFEFVFIVAGVRFLATLILVWAMVERRGKGSAP